jgi:hypothetical protein
MSCVTRPRKQYDCSLDTVLSCCSRATVVITVGFALLLIFHLWPWPALAGPPFRTDDPEPVEYKHWEVYVASQGSFDRDETSLTAPHVEINYGLFPNVQIHLIAPFEYVKPEGEASHYGFADL